MTQDFISRVNGGRRHSRYQPMSEINVTPFVDVMLVLLVVFMVTAPLLTVGVEVDLPKIKAQPMTQAEEPLVITIDAEGIVYIQDTTVELEKLVPRLVAITQNKPDTRIYVRGDRSVEYGRVMEVMGRVSNAGFTRVALVTEMPSPDDKARAGKKDERG